MGPLLIGHTEYGLINCADPYQTTRVAVTKEVPLLVLSISISHHHSCDILLDWTQSIASHVRRHVTVWSNQQLCLQQQHQHQQQQ